MQLAECFGSLSCAVTQNLRHGNLGVVIEHRQRYPTDPLESADVAIEKRVGRFRRVGFDEDSIRVRQVEAKVVNPGLDATQVNIGFAEIHLRPSGHVEQGNEDFLLPNAFLRNILADDGVTTAEFMFVPQTLINSPRSMSLLLENVMVSQEDLFNDSNKRTQLRRYRRPLSLVPRRQRMPNHLGNGFTAQPELSGRATFAEAFDHHSASYFGVDIHFSIHPLCLPQPYKWVEG